MRIKMTMPLKGMGLSKPSRLRRTALLVALVTFGQILLGSVSHAQTQNSAHTRILDGSSSPAAQIEDLSWLAGYWRGNGLGGQCEELWSEPFAGRMLGSFAMMRDGELVFSEAMALVEDNDSLVLKIRHFDAGFIAWEDKADYVSFELVETADNIAWFNGLTFHKTGPDTLEIFLVLHDEGNKTEHKFEFKRVYLRD